MLTAVVRQLTTTDETSEASDLTQRKSRYPFELPEKDENIYSGNLMYNKRNTAPVLEHR
jgi:hypothetical protein